MAKAAVCITACTTDSVGKARVSYQAAIDSGLVFGSDAVVDFSSSVIQMGNDIKDSIITAATGLGGPLLVRADVTIFGGPS